MKPNIHNPYGYKICYQEKAKKELIKHFQTYTYRQARLVKDMFHRFPQRSKIDQHKLKKPTWYIIPITKKEFRDGIWRSVPY